MQIILTQDVLKVGKAGDLVVVKPGYARNYLIPQGLAMHATKGALKQAEIIRNTAARRTARELATAQDVANAISALHLTFQRKVGENGRLYGSVTAGEVAEQITAQLGREIERRRVDLDEPIKALGDFGVAVFVHPEVKGTLTVTVIGENGETAADFAAPAPIAAIYDEPQPMADY